jgi:hypothetical protein
MPQSKLKRLDLDSLAKEALVNLAWLFAACGFSLEEASATFTTECSRVPRQLGRRARASGRFSDEASHAITLWHMDPQYLGPRARPIPLPLNGPAPSLEALIKRVNPKLNFPAVLAYFRAAKTLKKVGLLYVPTRRYVAHKAHTRFQSMHSLRVVSGLLRTVRRNGMGPRWRWFEGAADGTVPGRGAIATRRALEPAATQFLEHVDAFLLRRSAQPRGSKKGKRTPLSVGVFMFEGTPLKTPRRSAFRSCRYAKKSAGAREAHSREAHHTNHERASHVANV